MLTKYRRLLQTKRFDAQVRGIHRTPPLALTPASPLALVSQLRDQDVTMYLVALKTFARFCPPARVVLVADRMSDRAKAVLRAHVPAIEIRDIETVDTAPCPRGGTWERLLTIIDLSREHYVIQLDADTVTVAEPADVRACIDANRSFTLGTLMGDRILPAREAATRATEIEGQHVQVMAERALERLPDADTLRYVRGNSAFAGFARGAHERDLVARFSEAMTRDLGAAKWAEWGSEQVASNFAVANTDGARVLPVERYSYFHPERDHTSLCFIHFMGTYRFDRGTYARTARQAVTALPAS